MKTKRCISILLALCLVLALLPVGTLAAEDAPELVEGYYEIHTADQLYWFAEQVNYGETSINGKLMADIVVNENVLNGDGSLNGDGTNFRVWTPMGHSNARYEGTFDGNGMTVSGLYYYASAFDYTGLFGYIGETGVVKDLGVADSYFYSRWKTGGIAGWNNGTISGCFNSGSVSGKEYNTAVGGIVGNNNGTVTNCYNAGTINGGDNFTGGIVGSNQGSVSRCHNSGTVSGKNNVGGITGQNDGDVSACYNIGAVSGKKYVGGVVGENYDTVSNCYNTGTVSGNDIAAGIAGANSGIVDSCFNTGSISGVNEYAPVVGANWSSEVYNCFHLYDCCDYFDYYAEGVSEREFMSGYVAYWLQGEGEELIWGQNIGTDELPVLGGQKVYQLSSCGGEGWGYANSEDAVLDHYYYEEVILNGCDQDGYTLHTCAFCGDSYTDNETAATGHIMVNGICQTCGNYEEPDSVGDAFYEIYNVGQLYWFAQQVNSGYTYISGRLMADIVLNENVLTADGQLNGDGSNFSTWVPMENYCGVFDGNGKTISGLYINDPYTQYLGLFGHVDEQGVVKNLSIEDSYVYGNSYVGGFVGSNDGAIINCSFNGTVEGRYMAVGGIAGAHSGTISNCYVIGSVTCKYYAGALTGQSGGKVYNSYYLEGTCDGSEQGAEMTAEQFASGEVAYLLQGFQSADIWGQEIGVDALPKLGGLKVYQACTGHDIPSYSNRATGNGPHDFGGLGIPGLCGCGSLEPAVLNGDVYEISNVGQLYWFAQKVNAGDTEINGKLMTDIVVNENVLTSGADGGWAWTPIGSSALPYGGVFDGNGKTVSGLFYSDEYASDIGLFGAVDYYGTVKNVGVLDSYFEGGTNVGAVVAFNMGTVSNCYSESYVRGNSYYAGGVVGYNVGSVYDCYNTGTVTGASRVGGVVGENSYGNVYNSYNTGSVSGEEYVGGVAGRNPDGSVWEVYNTGSVSGTMAVGGVIGHNYGSLSVSYNTGTVTASGNYVGGVVGENNQMVFACYNLGSVSGGSYVGGVVGSNGDYRNPEIYYSYNLGTVTGTGSYVGGVVGSNGYGSIYYSYYLSGCAADGNGTIQNGIGYEEMGGVSEEWTYCTEAKTQEQFASGEVCYLLRTYAYNDTWGQRIGTDLSPVFSDDIVYEADGSYTNTRPYGNLGGAVTSYVDHSEVTLELLQDGEVMYSTTVRGKNAEYYIEQITPGEYTLRLSKANHATREYEITIENLDMSMDLELNPFGDVTGDGAVNIKDFQRLLRHVNKTNTLEDYALACGDVTGDGNVNIKDFQRLLRHVNKTNPLYPDQKDVTIKVWVAPEDTGWLEELQSRFEAEHPEYCIFWINEAMAAGDVGYYVSDDPQASADVYMYAHDYQLRMIEAGGLAQLTDTLAQQVRDDNTQVAVDSVTHTDGEIYGLPVESNTWILYYNKQVFTGEDVKNLDTMLEKGRVSLPINVAWSAGAFFLGCGGTIFGENGRDAAAGIDFSGANGGYMAAKKMIELAQHPNAVIGGFDAYRLITGEADAVFGGYWNYTELKQALGDNLGIAMLPKFTIDGEEYQMTAISGTKSVGVNAYADDGDGKLELCTEFAAYLASAESQLLRYELRNVTPIHVDLAENEAVMASDLAMAEINTMRDASVVQSYLNEMSQYWDPMQNFCNEVLYGEINLDNYMEAVDELNELMNAQ